PAGGPARTIRGGAGTWPQLRAHDAADRAAAGAENRDPGDRQQLHQPVQGHEPRPHHRAVRPARHRPGEFHRLELGIAEHRGDGLRLRRPGVLDLLLRHVALFDVYRAPPQPRPQALILEASAMADQSVKTATATGVPTVSETEVAVDIADMNKWYGDFHVLRNSTLKVMRGERIVICGPSGSGKSTMIRCINRLEEHQKGRIVVDGIELRHDLKKIDEVRREVGMVFQHFNLFPHLTVMENLTLAPIYVRKMSKKDAEEIAM